MEFSGNEEHRSKRVAQAAFMAHKQCSLGGLSTVAFAEHIVRVHDHKGDLTVTFRAGTPGWVAAVIRDSFGRAWTQLDGHDDVRAEVLSVG